MADSVLPPSRFGVGFTAGSAPSPPPGPPTRRGTDAPPAPHEVSRFNKLAVVSFVGALFLGLVAAPISLPLAYLAQRQIRASGEGGARLAGAAMIISAVYLAIGVVVVVLYVFVTGPQ